MLAYRPTGLQTFRVRARIRVTDSETAYAQAPSAVSLGNDRPNDTEQMHS